MQLNRFRLRAICTVAALALSASAWAVNPFTVRDIRVEGLERVEPGTVFASMPLRVGDTYTDELGAATIRSLFALGIFKDVGLKVEGDVLVVIIQERPSIGEVEFAGAKEFDKDNLKKALKDVGIAEGQPFDKALADRAEQELKRQYINRSMYAAEVVTTVTPTERNRVNLTFTVTEGEPASIREIKIVGNKVFSESTLLNLFDLGSSGWLTWYTKADRYSRTKLNADLESLKSYYLTRGYLEFKVDSTQVAISPNKKDMTITINVTEGVPYVVSEVKLEGNYLGRDGEFKTLVQIKPGQPYNADQVTLTQKLFTDYFGNFGYAFARVEARPEIDRKNNRVVLTLSAEPSRRAYVRRVIVAGNTRTRDEVVRREFRQFESAWYDGDKIKLSRDRVDRLGYFKEVTVDSQDVPGSPDQVDVIVTVTEKPTGSLSLGAGYSSADGLGFSFGIRQDNIFGSGKSLGLQVNTSHYNRVISVSTTDPYFTNDGVSRTIDVYHRSSNPYQDPSSYQFVSTGGALRFGVPFSEVDTVFFGAGIERTTIVPGSNIPNAYLRYANTFGYTSVTYPLTVGWGNDTRDSALTPTSGKFQRASAELSLWGDARYARGTYQYQQYYPLNKQFTYAFNGQVDYGVGLGGRPYPAFKNLYGGGLGSVRGFEQGSLGPKDEYGLAVGGSKRLSINNELMLPVPGAGSDKTLRFFAFYDLGNVWGEDDKIRLGDLRTSAGVGISWISPVGPLRIAFAKPLHQLEGDRIQTIQFQVGNQF